MDQIRENFGRISELSAEELKSLKDSVLTEFGTLETQDRSKEVVDSMVELASFATSIKVEQDRRAKEASELSTQAEEAIAALKGSEASSEEPEEKEESEEDDAEDEKKKEFSTDEPTETVVDAPAESEASVEEIAEPASEPVAELSTEETVVEAPAEAEAASEVAEEAELSTEEPSEEEATTEAELSTEEITPSETVAEFATDNTESSEEAVTASNTPEFEAPEELRPSLPTASDVTIYAGSDLPGITAGAQLPNLKAVAQAFLDRKKGMGRTTGGDGEQALVASIKRSFPEEIFLNSNDVEGNRAKVENGIAIVAAGGLMGPVDTSRELFSLGETEARPVRDSLPSFGADRGGLRFLTPPLLSDLDGAVSVWTLADDLAAAEPGSTLTKPCLRVQAGEEVTVYIEAIPLCLTFGNLGARAFPELVERHIKLAMVQHARFADMRLLTRIGALSTAVTADAELGAARDIFNQIEVAAAAYRGRYRIDPNTNLRVMFPEWFKNALRSDLIKQLPGDGRDGTFNLADAEINRWFAVRNINVTWFLEGEAGQNFGAQAAGALNGFPATIIWYLFSEGTFLFLDGGELDLGLVRDSTLNGTNDYKIFLETFEGVAKVGVESLRVTSALGIYGATAATVSTVPEPAPTV